MEKNKLWIVLLALVLTVGGAALLYGILGRNSRSSQLQTLPPLGSLPESGQTVTVDMSTSASLPASETGRHSQEAETTKGQEEASRTGEKETSRQEMTLYPAPEITVYDAQGKEYKLSDFKGKPVVLNFWASWCPPCKAEMPDFDVKYKETGEDVHFLMVNVTDNQRETVSSASRFIEEQGFSFPVYYDSSQQAALTYQTFSIPCTFFIDAEGYLVANALGSISGEILQQGIDMIREPAGR